MFDIEEYNYSLPEELIAQFPAPERDRSRLQVVDRINRSLEDCLFSDLPSLLRHGDLLVVNDTRVVPARLFGKKETGGKVEVLVLEHGAQKSSDPSIRVCMVKASKSVKPGTILFLDSGLEGKVLGIKEDGLAEIQFNGERSIDSFLREKGTLPLPPYIRRSAQEGYDKLDRERYQTLFSSEEGAVAAPTAGLHFSETLIRRLRAAGISIAPLTLHVSYGTFRPVRTTDIRNHKLGEELYKITKETSKTIERTRKGGGRIVAVGTTVVRALETAADSRGLVVPGKGMTDLLITPGYRFKAVDSLITNFHLPRSSLLFLVAAFCGRNLIHEAYQRAIEKRYRFYSYGDAMLIL